MTSSKINASKSPSLFETAVRTFALFDQKIKARFGLIFVLMVLTSALELLNIGLFFPLMKFVLEHDQANGADPFMNFLSKAFEFLNVPPSVFSVVVLVLSIFVFKNLALLLIIYGQNLYRSRILGKMMTKLAAAYAHKPYEEILRMNSAHAVYDISITAPGAVGSIIEAVFGIAIEILMAGAAAVALVVLAPVPTLFAAAFISTALVFYFFLARSMIVRLTRIRQKLGRDISRWAHACLGSSKETTVLNRSAYFINNIDDVTQEQARCSATLGVLSETPRVYGEIIIIAAFLLTAVIIVDKHGSINDALPLLSVFAVAAFRVFPSANRITHHTMTLKQAGEMLNQVYDDLRATILETKNIAQTPTPDGVRLESEMRFVNVSYQYPDAKDWTLEDLNFELKRGEAIGLVGSTGAGKSTLVDIVLGLLQPKKGELLVDGKPPEGASFWRGGAGYVPQEIFLMDDSIRRNIAIGIPDEKIEEDRIQNAVSMARLDSVIKGQPDGVDTVIGERGVRLSGGQRQRIGIARALYNNPDLLVFDEATSFLDSQTEYEVNRTIHGLKRSKTLIIIAHRLSTIRECDRLIFLKKGRILGIGTFEELQAHNEEFATMVKLSDIR